MSERETRANASTRAAGLDVEVGALDTRGPVHDPVRVSVWCDTDDEDLRRRHLIAAVEEFVEVLGYSHRNNGPWDVSERPEPEGYVD